MERSGFRVLRKGKGKVHMGGQPDRESEPKSDEKSTQVGWEVTVQHREEDLTQGGKWYT